MLQNTVSAEGESVDVSSSTFGETWSHRRKAIRPVCPLQVLQEQFQVVETNGINYTDCQKKVNIHSVRERWWFLAISNCRLKDNRTSLEYACRILHRMTHLPALPGGGGITLEYKITMSNGKDLWRRHFSADQIGILEVHILSVLLFIITLGVCICFARK
ncbi:transmembrane protein 145-like [Carcharodon carcharias]|uniref:transmembrane protein 145-like n=1 Tax=Carcharodon carcharias TaxID=13397 RepID=UPI001B7F052C|nr:transmembrane protein 145-like [Carcharodon carcharias]